MYDVLNKIKRKLVKLRLQPIRVLCFHHVSEVFDESTMWECDWTQIDQFKKNIKHLQSQCLFISLPEAYKKLKHDRYRFKKYAVLTADDGWASLNNILPWLVEQEIPVTLFVNPAYLIGKEVRENNMSGLLKERELREMLVNYPNITIASHGWNHQITTMQSQSEFIKSIEDSADWLSKIDKYIPYFAYPCGYHTKEQDRILQNRMIIPVYCDGQMNYNDDCAIHREPIDGKVL